MRLILVAHHSNGTISEAPLTCRVDTEEEVAYIKAGGILHYVIQSLKHTTAK
jgi:aconitate hydratase